MQAVIRIILIGGILVASVLRGETERSISCGASFADIAESVKDSVVNIASLNLVNDEKSMKQRIKGLFIDPKKDLFGAEILNAPQRVVAAGSGFVIKGEKDGTYYVVTNNHVVEDAISLRVILTDESVHVATLVGKDADTDLAVLKFQTKKKLKVLSWGDSEKVRIGDWSMALGNPYGLGGTSLTTGVISYLSRDLGASKGKRTLVDNYIQTEAAINPGNSGGPLMDVRGHVIGVNTVIVTTSGSSHNVGFAVPSELAQEVVSKLIEHKTVRRSWLGAEAQPVNEDLARYFGVKSNEGGLIAKVRQGSPADQAGMKAGDIVTSINGKPIKKFPDFSIFIRKIEVGEMANIEVIRQGKKKILHPVLQEYQYHETYRDSQRFNAIELKDHIFIQDLGFGVTTLTPQFRQRFGIVEADIEGVFVTDVKEESVAEKFTFVMGDVIMAVNDTPVRAPQDVKKSIENARKNHPEKPILFTMYRGGMQEMFVAVDPSVNKDK